MDLVAGTAPDYIDRWGIQQTGETVATPSGWLVPGRWHDRNVMLKVARVAEEARGGRLLGWWAGSSVVDLYKVDDHAVLMAHASGQQTLTAMCHAGRDDEVTRILCETIGSLHKLRDNSSIPASLVPLSLWFQDLVEADAARPKADNIARAAADARTLLQASAAEDHVVLHGDIHHRNVLDFDGRWRAIDPKGLFGHRAFDYANIFCNPATDLALSNFHRRLAIVSEHSGLDVETVRSWLIAWCALSVTWTHTSGGRPWTAHAILDEFG